MNDHSDYTDRVLLFIPKSNCAKQRKKNDQSPNKSRQAYMFTGFLVVKRRFENPQAVYKWITGKSLPSIDNLIILSKLLHSSVEEILVIDGDVFIFGVLNRGFNDNGISSTIRPFSLM